MLKTLIRRELFDNLMTLRFALELIRHSKEARILEETPYQKLPRQRW